MTFFVTLDAPDRLQRLRDVYTLLWVGEVLETRLLERLRFSLGSVYSVQVSVSFAFSPPQRDLPIVATMMIDFGNSPVRCTAGRVHSPTLRRD